MLTDVVGQFATHHVSPAIRLHLISQKKDNTSLYLPGSDVPCDLHSLLQIAIQAPLTDELEQFVLKPRLKPPTAQKLELLIRTTAETVAPAFAPMPSVGHAQGSNSSTEGENANDRKPKLSSVAQQVRRKSASLCMYVLVLARKHEFEYGARSLRRGAS
jgi:hypothetical protein